MRGFQFRSSLDNDGAKRFFRGFANRSLPAEVLWGSFVMYSSLRGGYADRDFGLRLTPKYLAERKKENLWFPR